MGALEFELEVLNRANGLIYYNVLRKGLVVGILTLEQPYDEKYAEKRLLQMFDNYVEVKNEN